MKSLRMFNFRRLAGLLFMVSLVAAAKAFSAESVSIEESLRQGEITMEIAGLGGSTGDSILVVIQRQPRAAGRTLRLTLSPGTVFASVSGKVQNMAGARIKGERMGGNAYHPVSEIVLSDDNKHSYIIEAYCLDFHKDNPGPSDRFTLSPPDALAQRLLSAGQKRNLSIQAVQAAVWMKRDGVSEDKIKERFPRKPGGYGEGARAVRLVGRNRFHFPSADLA